MPVNELIARGVQPIGRDLPEIANMLAQRKQTMYQNQLAQEGAQRQQAMLAEQQGKAASKEDAERAYAEASYMEGVPDEQLLPFVQQNLPHVAEAASKAGISDVGGLRNLARNVKAKAGAMLGKVQEGAPVPFEQTPEYKMEQVKAVNARKLEQLRQSGRGGADAPSGYQWANGALAPIPGGPADPQGPAAKKQVAPLRKEFRSLESVKAYETIVPLIKSAAKAPDSGYGDLQLIYTVGKILDPGSVVREGELALTIKAGTMMSQLFGAGRFQLGKGGRIPPAQRQQIMEMLKERSGEYKNMYDRDYQTYTQYAEGSGISPYEVVGAHPDGESGSGRGAVPSVGEVVDGYRFKGGDPSKQASWEQVR